MRLRDVEIAGFGVWSELKLDDLSPKCTVFYGPNEAGKTTLLEFLRAALYGISSERRVRYLPPLRGGNAGGTITVADSALGKLRIQRGDFQQPDEQATVQAADGTPKSGALVKQLLHDVDEITFENVFAIGLREVQELGTLTDLEAAKWLYSISMGIDRVSLHQVQQELEHSRNRIAATDDRPSQIGELILERDRLLREIEQCESMAQRHADLLAKQSRCEEELLSVEKSLTELAHEREWMQAAIAIYEPWRRRSAACAQLDAISSQSPWPDDAVARMNRISSRIETLRQAHRRTARRCAVLSRRIRAISLDENIWRKRLESWQRRSMNHGSPTLNKSCVQPKRRSIRLPQNIPRPKVNSEI